MALEIGAAQGPAVTRLARQAFPAAQIDLAPDYAGLDRVVLVDTERQPQTQEPLCRSS
jgi:methylase of polypeptide subunit release factors